MSTAAAAPAVHCPYLPLFAPATIPFARHLLPHRRAIRWMYRLLCPRSVYRGVEAAACSLSTAGPAHAPGHLSRHVWVGSLPRPPTSLHASPCVTATFTRNVTTQTLDVDHDTAADEPSKDHPESSNLTGFFSPNQRRFANSSTLPASFYVDIQRFLGQFASAADPSHQLVCNPIQESVCEHFGSPTPPTICKGLTAAGRPCRRPVAVFDADNPAELFCWQHKDQVEDHVPKLIKAPPLDDVATAQKSASESLQDLDAPIDDSMLRDSQSTLQPDKAWNTKEHFKWNTKEHVDRTTKEHFKNTRRCPPDEGFQPWSDARSLTSHFVNRFYRLWVSGQDLPHAAALDFLRHHQFAEERSGPHNLDDILSWSWILAAPGSLSARRLAALNEHSRRQGLPPVPLWVTIQLLRAVHVDNHSIKWLLDDCSKDLPRWSNESRDAQLLLIVRMLHHSRKSAAVLFEDIIGFAIQIMATWPNTPRQLQVTTSWCNKLLSFLALPSSPYPLNGIRVHQAAQLAIVRFMHTHIPRIPVTREGYRALSGIQLMHPKTPEEQDWARAKSAAWPPWQPINPTGLEVKVDFPGKTTRVMKVLRRMNDSGYSSHEFDVAAQVLSGWDTDRSPTIQVRRPASVLPISAPWCPGQVAADLRSLHLVWLARIESTRSVREAWMCFCSYVDLVSNPDRSALVYYAMLTKLLDPPYRTGNLNSVLPGDDRAVYPDPPDSRDLVWIPEPVPQAEEFVRRMSREGHKLGPDSLAKLLHSTPSFTDAQFYVANSILPPGIQSILAQQNVYIETDAVTRLRRLPKRLLASYVHFLAYTDHPSFVNPSNEPNRPLPSLGTSRSPSLARAWNILLDSRPEEPIVWEAFLGALARRLHPKLGGLAITPFRAWRLALGCLREMRNEKFTQVPCTFKTFGFIASMALHVLVYGSPTFWEGSVNIKEAQDVARLVFAEAAVGDDPRYKHWSKLMGGEIVFSSVPTGHHIERMAWIIWLTSRKNQAEQVLELLRWLQRNESRFVALGGSISKHNLSAFRIMLEGHWADDAEWNSGMVSVADDSQLKIFEELCDAFGYPDDDDVLAYLDERKTFIRAVRERMQYRTKYLE